MTSTWESVTIRPLATTQTLDLKDLVPSYRSAGMCGFLIGKTAEGVLNQVDGSVLTVQLEGFARVTLEDPASLTSNQ